MGLIVNTFMRLIDVLNDLMETQGLSLDKLAKLTGVSRSNINRLRTDPNCNPTLSTLLPLAKFFNITIEQLVGEEEIENKYRYNLDTTKIEKLPILHNETEVHNFLSNQKLPKNPIFTYAENIVSNNSFGFKVSDDSLSPLFPRNFIIIFDPEKKIYNGTIVLVFDVKGKNLICRKFSEANGIKILTDIKTSASTPATNDFHLIAPAVECHAKIYEG